MNAYLASGARAAQPAACADDAGWNDPATSLRVHCHVYAQAAWQLLDARLAKEAQEAAP